VYFVHVFFFINQSIEFNFDVHLSYLRYKSLKKRSNSHAVGFNYLEGTTIIKKK